MVYSEIVTCTFVPMNFFASHICSDIFCQNPISIYSNDICSKGFMLQKHLFQCSLYQITFIPMDICSNKFLEQKFLEQMSIGTNNCGTCNTVPFVSLYYLNWNEISL